MIEGAGTTLKAAVDVLRLYGAVPDTLLPFKLDTAMSTGSERLLRHRGGEQDRRLLQPATRPRPLAHLADTARPDPGRPQRRQDVGRGDLTGGKLDEFQPNTTRGGHAVAVVGYTNDNRFIVRNSWGTAWGDSGFAYASEDYIKAAFFNESYGVPCDGSAPIR